MKLFFRTMATTRRGHRPPGSCKSSSGPNRRTHSGPPHHYGHILMTVKEHQGVSQSELSKLLGVRPQSLSEGLVALEAEGMVQRQPDPKDKRQNNVFLTSKAMDKLDSIRQARLAFAADFFSPLNDSEREELFRLLSLICDHAEQQS